MRQQRQLILNPATLPVLDRIAREKGVSRSAVVRWAIDAYLASTMPSSFQLETVPVREQGHSEPDDAEPTT